ncbi:MAG: DNA polymerase III subunit delta [Saprospiraceae bacterium]
MSHLKIIESLQKKEYKPIYFLHGEETFFMDEITKVFEEEIMNESEKSFNFTVMYGKESNARLVEDNARRFPMMASHQIVILKEAQEMRTLGDLKKYAENPTPSTLLLICYKHKKYDMRSGFAKAVKKKGTVLECKKLYDNEIGGWVRDYLSGKGYDIKSAALDLMTEYLGSNLSKIANEVEKLSLNVPKGKKLTKEIIQENIGISKDYNVFELQEAVGVRDSLKVHRMVNHFASNPRKHPFVLTISSMYGFFSKLYIASGAVKLSDLEMAKALGFTFRDPKKAQYAARYRVEKFRKSLRYYSREHIEKVLALLAEYDLKSKGVNNANTSESELLKELVIRIMGV